MKEKRKVVEEVLNLIASGDPPGRFLKPSEFYDLGGYEELCKSDAMKKVAQALREKPKSKGKKTEGDLASEGDHSIATIIPPIEPSESTESCSEYPQEEIEVLPPLSSPPARQPRKRKTRNHYSKSLGIVRRRHKEKKSGKSKQELTVGGVYSPENMSEYGGPAVVSNDGEEEDNADDNNEGGEITGGGEDLVQSPGTVSHNDATDFEILGILNPDSPSFLTGTTGTNCQYLDDVDTYFSNDFFPPLENNISITEFAKGGGKVNDQDGETSTGESRILFSAI